MLKRHCYVVPSFTLFIANMSDMHGRKREKTTEEIIKARKEREVVKIKEYNGLVKKCHQKIDNKEYTEETLTLTSLILQWNPDFYTIWNYRRIILIEGVINKIKGTKGGDEEIQRFYGKELMLFMQLIKKNPKSYWLWNHRIWCLQTMPKTDWDGELVLVEKMLSLDARNFHGWDYRRYVIGKMKELNKGNEDEIKKLIDKEYHFTTLKINQSFSNYSAWHQRSKLLPDIVMNMTEAEKNKVALNEFELVRAAIYTDPEDQSAWLYYWWLLGKAPEHVLLYGAYKLEESTDVVFAFNDNIKLTQSPQILDKNDKLIKGDLHPLWDNQEIASVWVYSCKDKDIPAQLKIDSLTILPSSSAKTVPKTPMQCDIKLIKRDTDINRVQSQLQQYHWEPLSAKMYTDPTLKDQSSWYTLDKVKLLEEEITTVRDLLDLEPESAWALQTLVHFLHQLKLRSLNKKHDNLYKEMLTLLDQLIVLDSDRVQRYKDLRDKILFEQTIQTLVIDGLMVEKANMSIDLCHLGTIPMLSPLLLVHEVTVGSDRMKAELDRLPFLKSCLLKKK